MCAVRGWGGVCTRRGDILPARGKFRDGIKTANTPPSPLRVQRFSSMKRTPRVVIPPPHRGAEKMQNGSVLSPPTAGLPPKPSKAVSVGRGRATERASPAACGGTRDSSSARTTASIAFVWSAAKPLSCQMRRAGHGPTPHFRAETRTHLKPPSSPRGRKNYDRKVIQHEKRYQIQHAHGVR